MLKLTEVLCTVGASLSAFLAAWYELSYRISTDKEKGLANLRYKELVNYESSAFVGLVKRVAEFILANKASIASRYFRNDDWGESKLLPLLSTNLLIALETSFILVNIWFVVLLWGQWLEIWLLSMQLFLPILILWVELPDDSLLKQVDSITSFMFIPVGFILTIGAIGPIFLIFHIIGAAIIMQYLTSTLYGNYVFLLPLSTLYIALNLTFHVEAAYAAHQGAFESAMPGGVNDKTALSVSLGISSFLTTILLIIGSKVSPESQYPINVQFLVSNYVFDSIVILSVLGLLKKIVEGESTWLRPAITVLTITTIAAVLTAYMGTIGQDSELSLKSICNILVGLSIHGDRFEFGPIFFAIHSVYLPIALFSIFAIAVSASRAISGPLSLVIGKGVVNNNIHHVISGVLLLISALLYFVGVVVKTINEI